MMNIKIYRRLIIANIILFISSFIFLEYSKMFRLSLDKHWVYSSGHSWWLLFALPATFFGSLCLFVYSIINIKKRKFFYCIFSLMPIILFLMLFF